MNETEILLTVDGVEYPVDFALITGEVVLELRQSLAVSPLDLVRAIYYTGAAELPEVVALMVCSLRQRDEPADVRSLLRSVKVGSDIEVEREETGEDAGTPDLLAAYLAP